MQDDVPERARRAQQRAVQLGFPFSCSPETGRLLRMLTAIWPSGLVAESGSGTGYGAAWLLDGLGEGGRLVTVERDDVRAAASAELLAEDARATVLHGDWRLLDTYAPFDLFFCDGGGKVDDPDHVIALLAPRGILVLDNFTPSEVWPPIFEGRIDELRVRYLTDERLVASEVRVSSTESVIVAVRRSG